MTDLHRYRVVWGGSATTGAGLSTFYTTAIATGVPAALVTFFNALKNFFPSSVNWTIPNAGDVIRDTDGALVGGWTATGGGVVTGAASGSNWLQGAGARIVWQTGGIVGGRRVRGATFLTSMNAIEFQVDGTPQSTTVASVASACAALISSVPTLTVWSRPVAEDLTHVPPIAHRDGTNNVITSGTLADKTSWLISRRT